jgi:hypothetical protein
MDCDNLNREPYMIIETGRDFTRFPAPARFSWTGKAALEVAGHAGRILALVPVQDQLCGLVKVV